MEAADKLRVMARRVHDAAPPWRSASQPVASAPSALQMKPPGSCPAAFGANTVTAAARRGPRAGFSCCQCTRCGMVGGLLLVRLDGVSASASAIPSASATENAAGCAYGSPSCTLQQIDRVAQYGNPQCQGYRTSVCNPVTQ